MPFSMRLTALSLAALSASVYAQTPSGFTPSSDTPVSIKFNSTVVDPNGLLISKCIVDEITPTIYSSEKYDGTYTYMLVDLTLPWDVVETTDYASLVPGIGTNRTTRLHWWMDEVTQGSDGVFTGSSTIANYEGPEPPSGDEPHDYVIFLFNRPSNYTPYGNETYYNATTYNGDDRMNFSVPAVAAQIGSPIASRYFRTEYANCSSTSTTSSTSSSTTASSTSTSNSTSTSSNTTTSSTPSASAYSTSGSEKLGLSTVGFAVAAMAAVLLI